MTQRKRSIPLNEGHHCLLEEFATTRAICFAAEELDNLVCQSFALHVEEWKNGSGLDLDGNFDWDSEDQDIHLYKKSWALGDELDSDSVLHIGFGIFDMEKEREDEPWISHFIGIAVEPLKVYYRFDGLLEIKRLCEEKEKGQELYEAAKALFSGTEPVFQKVKQGKDKDLYFWSPLRLVLDDLARGLDPENPDPAQAFQPITKALEDFKNRIPALDALVEKALALAPTPSDD